MYGFSLKFSILYFSFHNKIPPHKVAVMDIDICGPSIPRIMGVEGETVHQSGSGWSPVVSTVLHLHFIFMVLIFSEL